MKYSLLVLALASVAFQGCSKTSSKEKTRPELASSCKGRVDVTKFPELQASEIADGKEGVYKLTDSRIFVESTDGTLSYFAGSTKLDKNAAPVKPSETTAPETPGEKPSDTPPTPSGKPTIEAKSSVICSDTGDISKSQIEGAVEAPLAISREDGTMPESLRFTVKSHFVQHGEKSEVTEKSATEIELIPSTVATSVLTDAAPIPKYYRVSKTGFAIRTEETNEKAKKISVMIYQLTPKATPAPAPEPTPEPTATPAPTASSEPTPAPTATPKPL